MIYKKYLYFLSYFKINFLKILKIYVHTNHTKKISLAEHGLTKQGYERYVMVPKDENISLSKFF